jgi:radical SAM protein with 4Fe4S-binding SPASM domain
MNLTTAKRYIEQIAMAGAKVCILVGGEPTIYPNLLQLIEFMSALGIKAKLMSNGRRLAQLDFVRQLKAAGIVHCSISIEGTSAVHDNVTRISGSFDQAIRGLKNCQAEGVSVNSITTVGAYNLDNIPDLVLFFQNLGLRRSAFNMCSAQPSGYQDNHDDGIINLATYARLVENIGLSYDFVNFYALIPLCLFDQNKLEQLLQLGRLNVACALFDNVVTVDPEGNLVPCTHMAGLSYGNLNDLGAVDKFLARKELEREYLRTHAPSEKCIACKLWNTCLGGCNLIWFSRRAQDNIPGIT